MVSPSSTPSPEAKPANLEESKLNRFAAIKRVASLNDEDFKDLHKQAADFIGADTKIASVTPRTLSNRSWAELTDELVDDLGLGEQHWNAGRKGYDASKDLVYPKDKAAIRLIVFALMKFEAIKQTRPRKRGAPDVTGAVPPAAKKARVPKPAKATAAIPAPVKATPIKIPQGLKPKVPPTAGSTSKVSAATTTTIPTSKVTINPSVETQPCRFSPISEPSPHPTVAGPVTPTRRKSPGTLVTVVDGNFVEEPKSPATTVDLIADSVVSGGPSTQVEVMTATSDPEPRPTQNVTLTPSLTPPHLRAVTEPATNLAQTASLALTATEHALRGIPPRPYRSLPFNLHLISSDPEITLTLERQVFLFKPIDLPWYVFIGKVALGLRSFKSQVAFHSSTQCKVRTANGVTCFPKDGDQASDMWQGIMDGLVEGDDDEAVTVMFYP